MKLYNLFVIIVYSYLTSLSIIKCFSHHHNYNNNFGSRSKRQENSESIGEADAESIIGQPCDFGTGTFINPCQWSVPNGSHPIFRWRIAQGSQQFWLGGPEKDHTLLDTSGGYAYFETSYQQQMNHDKYLSAISFNNQRQSTNNSLISSGSSALLGYSTSKKSKNSDEVIRPLISQFPLFQLSKPESKRSIPVPDYGLFQSPNISETGPIGLCLTFYYNIDGLSSDSLHVIILDSNTKYNRTLLEYNDVTDGEWRKSEILYTYADLHQIIFRANAKKLNDPNRLFRGYVAIDDPEFKQLDPKTMKKEEESCKGHCTFEASFCSWSNQDEDDDFDWKIGRGSQNLYTGPSRDFSSFDNNEISGGYVYIDSNYPRRPGDRALLLSPIMNPTNDNVPLCLKFAIHMYGNGVGALRVLIRYTSTSEEQAIPDQLLWEMIGESGNRWHVAQVPISSPVLSYQIVFEGEIGANNLGIIALDNIAFNEEECPVLPQTASKGNGDCTFDENMCLWNNPNNHNNKVDDFDWLRQFSLGQTEPRYDHTKRSTDGYFMNLNGDQPHRGGTRAWLYSPEFIPQSTVPKCMTFYYYMFERTIDSAGPSLGSLRIYVKTITDMGEEINLIWRLNNHQGQQWRRAKVPILIGQDKQPPLQNYQIIIEGIWGDGRVGAIAVDDISFYNGNCTIFPAKAAAVFGECAFDRDLCGYRNQSGKAPTSISGIPGKAALERNKNPNRLSVSKDSITWKLATSTNRPANLQDHTFRAPIGYAYFDVFNQNQVQYPILRSPEFQPKEDIPRCVSFWFTPFGRGDSTVLSVYVITMEQKDGTNTISEDGENEKTKPAQQNSQPQSGLETKTLVWRITTRKLDSVKPEWIYAQVSVQSELMYRIQFEGEAMDGGFALDDITYYEGNCRTRPIEAAVAPPPETGDVELRE